MARWTRDPRREDARPVGPVPPPVVPPSTSRPETVVRVVVVVLGASAVLEGGILSLGFAHWWPVLRWAAGGVLVHDAVVAPASVVVGFLVLRRVPEHWRDPLRGALLAVGTAVVLTVPLLLSGAHQRNASVLPTPGWVSVLVALAVPAVGAVVGAWVSHRGTARGVPEDPG